MTKKAREKDSFAQYRQVPAVMGCGIFSVEAELWTTMLKDYRWSDFLQSTSHPMVCVASTMLSWELVPQSNHTLLSVNFKPKGQ